MIELEQIIIGLVFGYLSITITESLSHGKLLHASAQRVKSWEKHGLLGRYIYSSWYSHHVVHHFRTFRKNHVTMFASTEEEERLRKDLIEKGKEGVVHDSYGLRIGSTRRKVQYLYTHIPPLSLIAYFTGIWSTAGIIVVTGFYIFAAEYVHPYIHLPYRDALGSASPSMKLFIRSRYFRHLATHHYIHHKYVNCNFNLVLGGDYLLGCHRSPEPEDLIEMEKLGLFVSPNKINTAGRH